MTVKRDKLLQALNNLLKPEKFSDYCPNGLQVQGKPEVKKLITGVTASQAFIEAAIAKNADAILVHHGYFWRGEDPCIVGMKYHRLYTLMRHDINLFAYHLPLDAHPEYGNNIALAKQLNLEVDGLLSEMDKNAVGLYGYLPSPMKGDVFASFIHQKLGQEPVYIKCENKTIHTIAWCTGAAQRYIDLATQLNVDAYLTGEASESTVHTARECGIHFFAAGHHATERYGVQLVGEYISREYGVNHEFIDIDNPV